jgi:hypothetical protein
LKADQFLRLAAGLTGTPVNDVTAMDWAILDQLLPDNLRAIRPSQLNELLLVVNKDRMELTFFDYFGARCTVGRVPAIVT